MFRSSWNFCTNFVCPSCTSILSETRTCSPLGRSLNSCVTVISLTKLTSERDGMPISARLTRHVESAVMYSVPENPKSCGLLGVNSIL